MEWWLPAWIWCRGVGKGFPKRITAPCKSQNQLILPAWTEPKDYLENLGGLYTERKMLEAVRSDQIRIRY